MVLDTAFRLTYEAGQSVLDRLFSPNPPPPNTQLGRPRIAIVGAGLTGVSAAAHCVGHGFDVRIFEARPRENLGGIWSRVNSTSSLQIHSLMYRFHPSIRWDKGYPAREQIVKQIVHLWETYGLQDKTSFDTPVKSVEKSKDGRWMINGDSDVLFDGIIAAVGTCGDPSMPSLPHEDKFDGPILHSSGLDGQDVDNKDVAIIGGGASAVEALEYAVHGGAKSVRILSRSDKWIIPRNPLIDVLLSFNIWGQETMFSFIPEALLRRFFYRDLQDIAPRNKSLFTATPMVNNDVLEQIRSGKAEWCRGDVIGLSKEGIQFKERAPGVGKNGPGREKFYSTNVVIKATGFHRPSLNFLPEECFEEKYSPPSWYLQTFPPSEASICANNCAYEQAIGTVGNYHIGIYTRLLLVFLIDPLARPRAPLMRTWVDMTRWIKTTSPTGAFYFFTYSELIWWFCFCIAINPFRWKWALFVFFGIGTALPKEIVRQEKMLSDRVNGE